jgi:hypothetical protein
MTKIGIIGSSMPLIHLADLINVTDGLELTGRYEGDNKSDAHFPKNAVLYPTLEALFRYVDSVVINHNDFKDISTVCKCLKHFKHVFLTEAQNLKYDDFIYLEKIAEESNVRLYLEFGGIAMRIPDEFPDNFKDTQYVDINHTFAPNEGICVGDRLSIALLHDLNFLTNLVSANVKKINANGWGFCEPGAGMLNVKVDFDNGTYANLLLVNSVKPREIKATLYGKSEIARISVSDNLFKLTSESLSHGQLSRFEKAVSQDNLLRHELELFLSAIQLKPLGLRSLENKYKSIRMTYLIHEKVNHFASINVFYS